MRRASPWGLGKTRRSTVSPGFEHLRLQTEALRSRLRGSLGIKQYAGIPVPKGVLSDNHPKVLHHVQLQATPIIIGARDRGIGGGETGLERVGMRGRAPEKTGVREQQAGSMFLLRHRFELRGLLGVRRRIQGRGCGTEKPAQHRDLGWMLRERDTGVRAGRWRLSLSNRTPRLQSPSLGGYSETRHNRPEAAKRPPLTWEASEHTS